MTELTPELIGLSDDYALGLLSPTEATLFEALMDRDPGVARHVGSLRDRMLPLDLSAPPVAVPADFAARVRRELPAQVVPLRAPPAAAPWRAGIGGLIAAAVVGLLVGFGGAGLRPLPEPRVVAVLVDDAGVPQAVIDDYGNDSVSVRFVADIPVPADRTLQVWTLPSPQIGPTSLGVLDRTAATQLRFPDLPDPQAQQLYEVTLEPLGGSPTGRPTGPIVGKGFAAAQT